MLTAILADDEEIVRSSMEKWIPWNELGVSLVGVASDGEEAYGMILSLHPDIVITDIRMPRLDGLELIKKVSEEKLVVSFIIISGFGEFEYAQKAMSYGVKYYLLKPVLKEKLRETILSVRTEIEEKQKEAVGNNLDNKYGFYLQRGMLMEILSDEALVESIVERSHKIIPFDVNEVLSMLVTEALETDKFVISMLSVIKKEGIRMPVFPITAGRKVFLILSISSLAVLEKMKDEVEARRGCVLSVLRGTPSELIHRFLQEAGNIKTASIYDGDGHRESVRVLPRTKDDEEKLIERYRKVLATGEEDPSIIDDITRIFSSKNLEEAESLFVIMAMKNTDYTLLFKELGNVKDVDELIALARSFIEHRIPRNTELFPVEILKKYIAENFSNPDISLKWISENVVYMNPEYLSRLFQKEVGQRFTDYLNTTRVNEACKLMNVYHQSTVSEIAEKVGYSNPGYFFHIFRRYTGMTPGEYMEKNRKGEDHE